jgi:hypothetical protein
VGTVVFLINFRFNCPSTIDNTLSPAGAGLLSPFIKICLSDITPRSGNLSQPNASVTARWVSDLVVDLRLEKAT